MYLFSLISKLFGKLYSSTLLLNVVILTMLSAVIISDISRSYISAEKDLTELINNLNDDTPEQEKNEMESEKEKDQIQPKTISKFSKNLNFSHSIRLADHNYLDFGLHKVITPPPEIFS